MVAGNFRVGDGGLGPAWLRRQRRGWTSYLSRAPAGPGLCLEDRHRLVVRDQKPPPGPACRRLGGRPEAHRPLLLWLLQPPRLAVGSCRGFCSSTPQQVAGLALRDLLLGPGVPCDRPRPSASPRGPRLVLGRDRRAVFLGRGGLPFGRRPSLTAAPPGPPPYLQLVVLLLLLLLLRRRPSSRPASKRSAEVLSASDLPDSLRTPPRPRSPSRLRPRPPPAARW